MKLIWLSVSIVALVAAGLSYYLYGRPSTLRIAVAQGSLDQEIMQAAARILRQERAAIQFTLVIVNDTAAVAKSLESGNADLAIIASNQTLPATGKTAVIMRKHAVLLLAPSGSKIGALADLKDKTIGMLSDGTSDMGRERILDAFLARNDIPSDAVKRMTVNSLELGPFLKSQTLDAVFVQGVPGDGLVGDAVRIVAEAGGGEPLFVPMGHVNALVQHSSAYEPITISAGTFDGATTRPAQDFETIAISIRLFASTSLRESLVGTVTRTMFALKPKLAIAFPVALRIQAPSTSKDASLPTHAGAAAYIDGEEENFFDRFSEFFYLTAMVLSIIGSAVAAVASRLSSGSKREYQAIIGRLLEILRIARLAEDPAMLRILQLESDNIFADFMAAAAIGRHDEQRVSTLGLIIAQVHQALLDRKAILGAPASPGELEKATRFRDVS